MKNEPTFMDEDDIIGASRSAYESKLAGCTEGPEFVFQKKAKQRKYIYIYLKFILTSQQHCQ